MRAKKGNQYWKMRTKHGTKKLFETSDILWESACEYFQYIEDNPLTKAIIYQGNISSKPENLMRAMTLTGLCFYLKVNVNYFTDFKERLGVELQSDRDFARVIDDIYSVIYTQKFEGASAGLLNANIIARDLGLVDKKSVDSKTAYVEIPADASPQDAAKIYNDLMSGE